MKKERILFINHKAQKCGVYEFGKTIGDVLTQSKKYDIQYFECDKWEEFYSIYQKEEPALIIYNYHPATMDWITKQRGFTINSYKIQAIQIGFIHEVTQNIADNATDIIFDYHIAADPTLLLKNPIVYKTGRLIPRFNGIPRNNKIINIGSFGFATNGKGFLKIIERVHEEFDEAVVNLNISYSKFLDENGKNARKIAEMANKSLVKKDIILNISHNHLTQEGILTFLSNNDLNVFLYNYEENRGISSAVDWAIAVRRPLAITKSSMFRHLFDCYPSICIEDNSLKSIIRNGINHLERLYAEWSPENLLWDYERIITDVMMKNAKRLKRTPIERKIALFLHTTHIKRIRPSPPIKWIKKEDNYIIKGFTKRNYIPSDINFKSLNRILDDKARKSYKSAIKFIADVVPEINAKKIPEANVQQAFVFDTVYRLLESKRDSSRILSIGAFEDTAAISLKTIGFQVDSIDPILNYDLATYITKPNIKGQDYDIITATSVIEHVVDDEQFIKDIAYLLKEGGVGILTCDFKDDYREGDKIPDVNFRFYTKKDLTERLLKNLPNCIIFGDPDWDCSDYDFLLANQYRYTFASFIFVKNSSINTHENLFPI